MFLCEIYLPFSFISSCFENLIFFPFIFILFLQYNNCIEKSSFLFNLQYFCSEPLIKELFLIPSFTGTFSPITFYIIFPYLLLIIVTLLLLILCPYFVKIPCFSLPHLFLAAAFNENFF